MYVLADLEWVEDRNKRIFFTQIAMVRVDEQWQPLQRTHHRIRPKSISTCQWDHVAFTGGTAEEFINASSSFSVFEEIEMWLQPDDVILWWFADARQWMQRLVPQVTNRQIVLNERVEEYLGELGRGNAYRVAQNLNMESLSPRHDSRNDVEMMRMVLAGTQFPQPIPEEVEKIPMDTKMKLLSRKYSEYKYDRFCEMAEYLQVSKTALAYRMEQLGLLERNRLIQEAQAKKGVIKLDSNYRYR